ncbi:hypothetical protein [Gellertiella hungarica]|uniref:Uncharacterized protein n=1 Tax=Gellertiella hungarica TaxID=1572859 RepID=A0A7W6J3E9_9HYPH|nr:hypothetical protein [Gellertiella hungarica]MBB4063183.1 hypothetical protein [Gellertiella hungarica]
MTEYKPVKRQDLLPLGGRAYMPAFQDADKIEENRSAEVPQGRFPAVHVPVFIRPLMTGSHVSAIFFIRKASPGHATKRCMDDPCCYQGSLPSCVSF